MKTPVVLIVFNRPQTTSRVLAAIRAARPPSLFVVADGPRTGVAGEAAMCQQVRSTVDRLVDWPCVVTRIYAEDNLGCARRVSTGLNEVFRQVEEAIILEDDCLPDPTFFPFCEELLARYRREERVAQIAGCSFQLPGAGGGRPSYYFSRYPHCWGWATWRRAWRHYDHSLGAWGPEAGRTWLRRAFEHPDERRWWSANFASTARGEIDSWAFRWTVAVLSRGWLGVLPYRNLVANIGFGPGATHTHAGGEALEIPVQSIEFPLLHPQLIEREATADDYSSRRLFRSAGLGRRLWAGLHRLWQR